MNRGQDRKMTIFQHLLVYPTIILYFAFTLMATDLFPDISITLKFFTFKHIIVCMNKRRILIIIVSYLVSSHFKIKLSKLPKSASEIYLVK